MTDARVLIVGSRDGVAAGWADALRDAGADLAVVRDGDAALRHLELVGPEVVLVDVRLEGGSDGFDTCRALRAHSTVAIVIAATHADPYDEVVALAVGADHYVAADCATEVVVARVRALVRRARTGPADPAGTGIPATRGMRGGATNGHVAADGHGRTAVPALAGAAVGGGGRGRHGAAAARARMPIGAAATAPADGPAPSRWASLAAPEVDAEPVVAGDVTIDEVAREVHVGDTPVALTRIEFELLLTLARQPRRVFTREQLLVAVWDEPFDGSHVLDTHLSRLRGKITAAGGDRIAHAVRGVGYRLRA